MDEEWWEGKNLKTGQTGIFNVMLTKGWEDVASGQAKDMQTLVRAASVSRKPSVILASKRSSILGSKNSSVISDGVYGLHGGNESPLGKIKEDSDETGSM